MRNKLDTLQMVMLGDLMSIMAAFYMFTKEQSWCAKKKAGATIGATAMMECPQGSVSVVTARSWEEESFALGLQLHSAHVLCHTRKPVCFHSRECNNNPKSKPLRV